MAHLTNNTNFTRGNWLWFRISGTSIEQLRDLFNNVSDSGLFTYMYAQFEQDGAHGLHLQGYAVSGSRPYKTQVMAAFNTCTHYAFGPLNTDKDRAAMAKYCRKEETRVLNTEAMEFGTAPANGNEERAAQKNANKGDLALLLKAGMSVLDFKTKAREQQYTWAEIDAAVAEHKADRKLERDTQMCEQAKAVIWKPWQQYVVDYIHAPAHPREILVILDKRSNSGKTFLMKNMKCMDADKTCNLTNGKTGDLMHIINKKPDVENIFVNLPRSVHGIVNYQAMEQAKDGEFCSTKYDGEDITIMPTRLVIFTNEVLNWDAMSHDRWRIMTVKGENFKVQNHTEFIMMGGETASKENMSNKRPYTADAEVEEAPKKAKMGASSTIATSSVPGFKPSIGLDRDAFCPEE